MSGFSRTVAAQLILSGSGHYRLEASNPDEPPTSDTRQLVFGMPDRLDQVRAKLTKLGVTEADVRAAIAWARKRR